jgi:hypothetical protein
MAAWLQEECMGDAQQFEFLSDFSALLLPGSNAVRVRGTHPSVSMLCAHPQWLACKLAWHHALCVCMTVRAAVVGVKLNTCALHILQWNPPLQD